MSLKASSSIADRNIEKSVGASTHPCLTPFVIANGSETSPPFLTFTIIPVCRLSVMVVNFSGHPCFLSSCHSPVLPTVSNAFVKSINTIYRGRSCSMHVSWSCRRQKIMSTVLLFEREPQCVSTISHHSDFRARVYFCSIQYSACIFVTLDSGSGASYLQHSLVGLVPFSH